jgi:hypothetical protein
MSRMRSSRVVLSLVPLICAAALGAQATVSGTLTLEERPDA